MTQLKLFRETPREVQHGGSYNHGKAKKERPLLEKKPLHVTIRSTSAVGARSLLQPNHARFIKEYLRTQAKKWRVKVYEYSVNGNHLHLLVKTETRLGFQNFLRSFCGVVARKITKAERGRPFGKRFWDHTAWSRIVEWGKAFTHARRYVVQNQDEADGRIPYQPRRRRWGARSSEQLRPSLGDVGSKTYP